MNLDEYSRMHALEDWYWWFVARREAAARFLRDYAPKERPLRILDAGCGTGGMLDLYGKWPDAVVTGADFSKEALRFSRERGHEGLVEADLTALPFDDASFDAVSVLDVIEHVPQDARAVSEIGRVLRPGGVLVATVPAYQFLWGPHDVALHHQRRYRAGSFRDLFTGAGLEVVHCTYLLAGLFPLAAAMRLMARKRAGQAPGLPQVSEQMNRLLIGFQAAELALARRVPLPFGLSVLVVGRKPGV